jgi:phosphatidylglycerol:prolipoprotein diacylglycerol transferase
MSRRRSNARRPTTAQRAAVRPLHVTAGAETEALVVTRAIDIGEGSAPLSGTVRFRGRRVGARQPLRPEDQFVHDERIEAMPPGTGLASVTAWIYGRRSGEWTVDAELIPDLDAPTVRSRPTQLRAATWSWRRWNLSESEPRALATRWSIAAPLARIPAVLPGSYPALAALAFVIALVMQAALVAREGIDPGTTSAISAAAMIGGLVAAKTWYWFLHPDESFVKGGWAVDGFLVVAPIVAIAGLAIVNLPVGAVLDATAPGLFLAVTIGRMGCFLTGCCAGRPSASRWAIWSSDRRIGASRVPTQLIEAGVGLLLGSVALVLVVGLTPAVHGLIFVSASAAYAAARQGLLRLRVETRRSARTLPATAVAAAAVLIAVTAVSLGQPDHMPPVAGAFAQGAPFTGSSRIAHGAGQVAPRSGERKNSVSRLTTATASPSGVVATAKAEPR